MKIFRFFVLFLTLSMSMSCSGWVRSIGVIFGFLGGRLWGRGRLLAPPTASAESQRYTHINITTASMQRHSPAIVSLTGKNLCSCYTPPFSFYKFLFLFYRFSVHPALLLPSAVLFLLYSTCNTYTQKIWINKQRPRDKQCETEDGLLS